MKEHKKEEEKPKTFSFLKTPELKKTYFDMVNKKLDQKILSLKDGANAFFDLQKERVLKKLANKAKGKLLKTKIDVSVDQIFDKEGEAELTIGFISPYLQGYLEEAGKESMDLIAPQETFSATPAVLKRLQKRAMDFGDSVTGTTMDKLSATLAEGVANGEGITDLSNRVSDVYNEFSAYRSELIARTEATAANNEGTIEAFRQSNVSNGKEWINAGDDRVREEHQDTPVGVGGEIVGLDSIFSNGLTFPQEPNCRCVLGPAFLEK